MKASGFQYAGQLFLFERKSCKKAKNVPFYRLVTSDMSQNFLRLPRV